MPTAGKPSNIALGFTKNYTAFDALWQRKRPLEVAELQVGVSERSGVCI
jgi:hypothetical protein